MAKEKNAVVVLLFAIVAIVVLTTVITMQVAEKAAPKQAVSDKGTVTFTIVPSEQTTTPAAPDLATGRVTMNIIR
jgi:hypothetical protein